MYSVSFGKISAIASLNMASVRFYFRSFLGFLYHNFLATAFDIFAVDNSYYLICRSHLCSLFSNIFGMYALDASSNSRNCDSLKKMFLDSAKYHLREDKIVSSQEPLDYVYVNLINSYILDVSCAYPFYSPCFSMYASV